MIGITNLSLAEQLYAHKEWEAWKLFETIAISDAALLLYGPDGLYTRTGADPAV